MAAVIPTKRMIQVVKAKRGLISAVADELGCTPNTIYARAKKDPALQQAIEDARERVLDLSEAALQKAIAKGEAWAVKFALSTLGRHRGYVTRSELAGVSDQPLEVHLTRRVIRSGHDTEPEDE